MGKKKKSKSARGASAQKPVVSNPLPTPPQAVIHQLQFPFLLLQVPRVQQPGMQQPTQLPGMQLPHPGMHFPGVPQSEMHFPGVPQSEMHFPGVPQPEMHFPGEPQPEMHFPGEPQPEMHFPGEPQPGMHLPRVPQPIYKARRIRTRKKKIQSIQYVPYKRNLQVVPLSHDVQTLQGTVQVKDSSATVTSTSTTQSHQDSSASVSSTSTELHQNSSAAVTSTSSVHKEFVATVTSTTSVHKESVATVTRTSSLPCQDTAAAVTSTSGGGGESPTPAKGVIDVDSTNAARLLIAQPNILSDTSPDLWHKITVKPAVVDRVGVLNAINRRISPLKLIPYFFRIEDGHITFLVNNCNAPLKTLFKRNLKVPFLSIQIELKVQLYAKKVSLSAILPRIVSKRLSAEKTFLDLSNLNSIPEIQQVIYDPSDTSHLQQQLMNTAGVMVPNLVSLSLARNELSSLSHLTKVFEDKTKWRSLKVLDVTTNKIKSISDLVVFKSVPITELYLHNNPVCGKYKEEHSYISVIRVNFPHLTKLDGTYLLRTPGVPQWRPNYIVCRSHSDSGELADQFIEHFFSLYDGEDRTWLRGLYHEDAYFSLSSMYLPGQSTSVSARLTSYVAECRNLLSSSNSLKTKAALCHGAGKVLAKLEKLPRTQHDPYSFTVDLLYHSDTSTVLTVTGIFKEQNPKQKISARHFMRTFVLIKLPNDEYQIVNDIMYITNATTAEAENAFMYTKPPSNLKKFRPPRLVTESDKNSMIEMYSQLTEMTTEWSRKCLNSAGWDLREALNVFIELYEADKIPPEGFMKPKEGAKV